MRASPHDRREATRAFLRTFERLSISESSTDEAMRLSFVHPGLSAERAVNRANAIVNQLVFMTNDPTFSSPARRDVLQPYVDTTSPGAREPERRSTKGNEIYARIRGKQGKDADLLVLAQDDTDYVWMIGQTPDSNEKMALAQRLATCRLASSVVAQLDACFAGLDLPTSRIDPIDSSVGATP